MRCASRRLGSPIAAPISTLSTSRPISRCFATPERCTRVSSRRITGPAYGSPAVTCWLTLFDGDGAVIAEWAEDLRRRGRRDRDRQPPGARAIRPRRICRPAVHPCRRRRRPRRRQIRPRHVWRLGPDATGRCRAPTTPTPGRPTAMPASRRPAPASGSSSGSRTATRRRSQRARSGSTRWARRRSSRCRKRSGPLPAAPSMSPGCCRASPGRGRSNCAPASMSCARAMRSSPETAAASRTSMSSAPILSPTQSCPGSRPVLGKGYLLPAPILPLPGMGKPPAADPDGGVAKRIAARRTGLRRRG